MTESTRVPDLYTCEFLADVRHLYECAVARALLDPPRVVRLARAIRRHARRHHDSWVIVAMLRWEVLALIECRRPVEASRAWRSLRAELPEHLRDHERSLEAAVHYFAGRTGPARDAIEADITDLIRKRTPGFDLLFRVANLDVRPSIAHRVTLKHVYEAMGRPLTESPVWRPFVKTLTTKLLAETAIDRRSLLADPELLLELHRRIDARRRARLWTHVSRGEVDVVSPPEEVARSQATIDAARRAARERNAERRRATEEKLARYFGAG
jgi:hypothetical protein